mmetsp:Transcript_34971/g.104307  ORF Transcript_34971/g.104307 Transcript_34971/m.104307 type:complete len:240 (+) Transcript_34971:190-909(+)
MSSGVLSSLYSSPSSSLAGAPFPSADAATPESCVRSPTLPPARSEPRARAWNLSPPPIPTNPEFARRAPPPPEVVDGPPSSRSAALPPSRPLAPSPKKSTSSLSLLSSLSSPPPLALLPRGKPSGSVWTLPRSDVDAIDPIDTADLSDRTLPPMDVPLTPKPDRALRKTSSSSSAPSSSPPPSSSSLSTLTSSTSTLPPPPSSTSVPPSLIAEPTLISVRSADDAPPPPPLPIRFLCDT